jgi:hypothetical protein
MEGRAAASGAVMDVFDSDQFHSTSFDLAKLCGTVFCEEEGRSPFLKNSGRLRRPYFFADDVLRDGFEQF